jgi:hypothetical protein
VHRVHSHVPAPGTVHPARHASSPLGGDVEPRTLREVHGLVSKSDSQADNDLRPERRKEQGQGSDQAD